MQNYQYFATSSLNPPAQFLFFNSDDTPEEKELPVKNTRPYENFDIDCFIEENPKIIQKKSDILESPQKRIPLGPRKKTFIETSIKRRQKYLQARKGNRLETNELTTNVHTLLKGITEEMRIFLELNQIETQRMEIFKGSKANLGSIKDILSIESLELINGQKHGQKNETSNNINRKKINCYILQKLKSSYTIESLLKSKRMSLKSKLVVLKYLRSLESLCKNPDDFTQWRQPS